MSYVKPCSTPNLLYRFISSPLFTAGETSKLIHLTMAMATCPHMGEIFTMGVSVNGAEVSNLKSL